MKIPPSSLLLLGLAALGMSRDCRAEFSLTLDSPIHGSRAGGPLLATLRTVTEGTATKAGEVQLTLDATHLESGAYVASWGFNLAPLYARMSDSLSVARTGGTAPVVALSSTSLGYDSTNLASPVKAGLFDLGFSFEPAQANRFQAGQSIVFTLRGLNLKAESFLVPSAAEPRKAAGGYFSAAEIRGFGNGSSGSMGALGYANANTIRAVPEPASLAMTCLGLGAAGLARWSRTRRSAR